MSTLETQSNRQFGPKLRELRKCNALSLAEVAARTDVSEATMSRIETNRSDVSAPHLYRLANLFNVDVATFFEGDEAKGGRGARSISRHGEGQGFDTARVRSEMLCTDLRVKRMQPFLNRVTATELEIVGGLAAHDGEEFIHVKRGTLILHSEAYAPLELNTGDSFYFDATMPHAYLAADPSGVEFLVICSAPSAHSTQVQFHDNATHSR